MEEFFNNTITQFNNPDCSILSGFIGGVGVSGYIILKIVLYILGFYFGFRLIKLIFDKLSHKNEKAK